MAKNVCRLEVVVHNGEMVASLYGELDHHGAAAVRSLIDAEIFSKSPSRVALDLSALDFMDSSGLGLIMGRYALMKKMGGELCVRRPNERVLKIIRLAGLERMVRLEGLDTQEEGVENG